MRVVLIGQTPPPVHGANMMCDILLKVLQDENYTVHLISKSFSRSLSDVGKTNFRKILMSLKILIKILLSRFKSSQYSSYIIFLSSSPTALIFDIICAFTLFITGVKPILYLHTLGFKDLHAKSIFWRKSIKILFFCALKIVTLGSYGTKDILTLSKVSKIIEIPNTIDSTNSSSNEELPTKYLGKRTAIFYSNLLPLKGALDFLSFANEVHKADPKTKFVIAGAQPDEGHLKEIQSTISNFGLGNVIELTGFIDSSKKKNLLCEATVLVFTSHYNEAQPLVILEAMALGTPCISYNVGGVSDIIVNNLNGVLVSKFDIQGLTKSYLHIANDLDTEKRLSNAAIKYYVDNFSLTKFSNNWMRIIE